MSDSAAALCIAAVFEAAGLGERAARILHRVVDHIHPPQADDPDWLNLQLHYARIGAANAHFTNVPNLQGAESKASLESLQSSFRASAAGNAFKYDVPSPAVLLWKGLGDYAIASSGSHLNALLVYCQQQGYVQIERTSARKAKQASHLNENERITRAIASPEDAIDAWIYAAYIAVLMKPGDIVSLALGLGQHMVRCANECGDPVRAARVLAISALLAAEFYEDPHDVVVGQDAILDEAKRVGDGFHEGIISPAFGRYRVGPAGLEEVRGGRLSMAENASRANQMLADAYDTLSRYAHRGWATYALLQRIKALADMRAWKEVEELFEALWPEVLAIEILVPEFFVIRGQCAHMVKDFEAAKTSFEEALKALRVLKFPKTASQTVKQYIRDLPFSSQGSY
ncbi:hypothetical protein HB774_34645 (plasmid) [Rhizobium leguminosarum bv. viciae]|nr:hypothetical protein HB774_34645 [Rhizobium leguminosarum bv. viciae]